MAILKVAETSKRYRGRGRGYSTPKPSGSCSIHACLKGGIHTIILLFLIAFVVWGFVEALTAMLVDFIVNHDQGLDGFTMAPSLIMIDITEYEHRIWEDAEEIKFHTFTSREERMLKIRAELIKHCSNFEKRDQIPENYHSNCNWFNTTAKFQENNYFCAVIEHPEVFHKAYKFLVILWIISAYTFLGTSPLVIFAFVWQSQCIRLLLVYLILQLIPICTSLTLLYYLWHENKFELCGLDHMYYNIPVRFIFTVALSVKLIVKGVEIAFTIWFIYLIHHDRERRGIGMKVQKRVAPEDDPVTFNDEVLQKSKTNEDFSKPEEVDRIKKFGVVPKKPSVEDRDKDKQRDKRVTASKIGSESDLSPNENLPDDE